MRKRRPKPVSLNPMSATQKRWLWVMVGAAIILIAVGWMMTIRSIAQTAPVVRERVDRELDRVIEVVEDAGGTASEQVDTATTNLKAIQEAYEAEKAEQEETVNAREE